MGVKLLDRVRDTICVRDYSRRTEDAYVYWIRRYIVFHKKVHPSTMGAPEISAFLTWLAVEQRLSASTQNQAFCAVLFLYRSTVCNREGDGTRDRLCRFIPSAATMARCRSRLAHSPLPMGPRLCD